MNGKFYTPDGFNDTLPEICAFKKETENKLRQLFLHHGYREIETPGFEYLDVYSKPGFVAEEQLYKMTDMKGRLLAARYDGTVPAARYAAGIKDFDPALLPLRLCYIENMYRFGGAGGGKQNEFTQAGVELMGASSSSADAEVIALSITTALEAGIEELQVSIGQVKLFDGIAKQLGLDEDTCSKIKDAINAKDSVTIEKTADSLGLSSEDKELLLMIPDATGTYDIIESFEKRVTDTTALEALKNLREILDILDEYDYLKYVSVDAGLLGSVDYYTGMIFKGYTYEVGFPIISGGRYDGSVGVFGRDMECVGFSLSITLAITALMRQGLELEAPSVDVIIGYAEGYRSAAIKLAQQLREDGENVIIDVSGKTAEELDEYADRAGICAAMYVEEEA